MKTWIRRSLIAVVGAAALVGLTACGHRYGPHHGWNASPEEQAQYRERAIERIGSRLDLNEQQKARLRVLADKLQEQRKALAGASADPRADVAALVAGTKFDRARAQALVGEKTAAVTAKSPEVIAALADFYDSLDATQQAKVREFLQQRRHGWWRS